MKSMIVAYDNERTIGKNGDLPWAGALPADMRHFRSLTEGRSVIMGRTTYESLPEFARPLPRRQNIILTMSSRAIEGALIATSLEDAFQKADYEIMVIGGAQVYAQALPYVDRVYATEIQTSTDDGDAFFPHLDPEEWVACDTQYFEKDEANRFNYSFITYLRRNPSILVQSDRHE